MERTARNNAYNSEWYRYSVRSADNISCRYSKKSTGGQRVNVNLISMALRESDPDGVNQTYCTNAGLCSIHKRLICLAKDGSSVEEPGSRQKTRSVEISIQYASRDYLTYQSSTKAGPSTITSSDKPTTQSSINPSQQSQVSNHQDPKVESPSHCCDTKIITIVFSDRSMRHGSLTMTSIHTFRAPPQKKGTYMYLSL